MLYRENELSQPFKMPDALLTRSLTVLQNNVMVLMIVVQEVMMLHLKQSASPVHHRRCLLRDAAYTERFLKRLLG